MTEVARPPSAGLDSPPDENVTAQAFDRLREELDWCEGELTRAVLLHEIALLEDARGDESSAARDHLEAINAEPEFSEPLERLIAILRGRGSQKNLEKLLERLVEVADGSEERARALLERARYLYEEERDFAGAVAALEEATAERPDDATLWLLLELCAVEAEDSELRVRALVARAGACENPNWQSLLRISAAKLKLESGDGDGALAELDAALETKSESTFLVLQTLEDIARELDRDDVLARSLEAQAAVLSSARESDGDNPFGVPSHMTSAEHSADALYRAAEAHRRRGEVDAANKDLDAAQKLLPEDPVLTRARINLAQASGDTETAASFAKAALDRGAKGALAAALWMRVAERAAELGDAAGALNAVNEALENNPNCIPARVLQLDLCSATDASAFASALEAAHEQLSVDEARARCFLLAADSWARRAGDTAGAKAALSQAGMVGASPGTVARVSRYLSSLMGEAAWYDEATRRLLAAGAAESELAGLWFELVRSRLARGELDSARQTLTGLATAPGGARLAHLLGGYVLALNDPKTGADSLNALSEASTESDETRALLLAAALRAANAGEAESSLASLRKLFDDDAGDAVAAIALAGMAKRSGDLSQAAETLSTASLALDDSDAAAALALEAGIYYWHAGERSQAVEAFQRASGQASASGRALLSWALRAADPDSPDARRRALDASSEQDPGVARLERYTLELTKDADASVDAHLDGPKDPSPVGTAHTLARALCIAHPDTMLDALGELAELGGGATTLARAMAHAARLRNSTTLDTASLAESAAAWTQASPHPDAALESLAFSLATEDTDAEVVARARLAAAVGGDARSQLQASTTIVRELATDTRPQLIDGTDSITQLANLELSLPGCDPRRRARALLSAEGVLGDDNSAMMRTLAGYNLLAAGQAEAATTLFRSVVEAYPEEVLGWEGLRAAGEATGDRTLVAEACACLGDAVSEDARGAELWEYAALILIDELGDKTRGEFALSRAVERDVSRFVAFDKLFRLVRAKKDGERLLELITKRLEVAEDPEEIAKLFWERARVMRGAGDRAGALAALENVTMLEPDHVGALALSGEIYITTGQFAEAADRLARLASLEEAPAKQRLMSGVAAVDIYENKLEQPERALEVLTQLYKMGLSTLPVRERMARLAAKQEVWDDATQVLQQLMVERDSKESRIEAARLAMAIHRDRRQRPEDAQLAMETLLSEAPDDGEALDLAMTGILPKPKEQELLTRGRDTIVPRLLQDPLDAARVDRLARIAHRLDQPRIRQAALGALVALGQGTPEIDRELAVLDQRVARVPHMAVDEAAIPDLCDPQDQGPLPALMRTLATTFADALGPSLDALGVGKKQRVDPRSGLPIRNEIAAWAGALGLGDFEVYLGGNDPEGVYGVANVTPAIVIGAQVNAPLSPAHRGMIARELFALKRGTTILRHRDPTDVAALVVAACAVVDVQVPSPHYAMLGEFQRVLAKEMPRRVKKALPDLARAVQGSGQDIEDWVRAATSSLDRLASVAAGDVSWVLAHNPASRGQLGASMEANARAARILAFVLSPTYLSIREMLGMGVR